MDYSEETLRNMGYLKKKNQSHMFLAEMKGKLLYTSALSINSNPTGSQRSLKVQVLQQLRTKLTTVNCDQSLT